MRFKRVSFFFNLRYHVFYIAVSKYLVGNYPGSSIKCLPDKDSWAAEPFLRKL